MSTNTFSKTVKKTIANHTWWCTW